MTASTGLLSGTGPRRGRGRRSRPADRCAGTRCRPCRPRSSAPRRPSSTVVPASRRRAAEHVGEQQRVTAAVAALALRDLDVLGRLPVPLQRQPLRRRSATLDSGCGARVDHGVALRVDAAPPPARPRRARRGPGAVDRDPVALPGRVRVERVAAASRRGRSRRSRRGCPRWSCRAEDVLVAAVAVVATRCRGRAPCSRASAARSSSQGLCRPSWVPRSGRGRQAAGGGVLGAVEAHAAAGVHLRGASASSQLTRSKWWVALWISRPPELALSRCQRRK